MHDAHVHPCPKPKPKRRRLDTLYVCTCGALWVLRRRHSWDHTFLMWERFDVGGTTEAEARGEG